MKTSSIIAKESIIIALILAPVVYLILQWNVLPDSVPIHWDWQGNPNGYGPKWATSALAVGTYVLFLILPLIDPKRSNYQLFENTWFKLRLMIVGFISGINAMTIAYISGWDFDLSKGVFLLVWALIAMMGNYFTTVRPNWFVGIRTPWTLENETVWKKTHKVAGLLWFWSGIVGFVASIFIEMSIAGPLFLVLVISLIAVPVIYSFVTYKKLTPAE